jgi:hypothetical protein
MIKEQKLYSLSIRIDTLPKSINQIGRLHWAVKSKMINEMKSLVALAVGNRKPATPLEIADLIYVRHSAKCLDFDNLVNSFKAVQDGLVAAGVLKDDKVKNVGYPRYYWQKVPQKDGHITIEVHERNYPHVIPSRDQ